MGRAGFTLIEVLLVLSLLGMLFSLVPGIERTGMIKLTDHNEVQKMVDLLRWAQRRAITHGTRQYLSLEPGSDSYRIYELDGEQEVLVKRVDFERIDLVGINRSVPEMNQTFYFTPHGSPVFGCTITLKDRWIEWKVVIAVGTGKIRIDRK